VPSAFVVILPFSSRLVLEARRTDERQPAIGDFALVAVAILGERPVVAEKDDLKPFANAVVIPVVHPSLGWFIAECRLVLLDEEVPPSSQRNVSVLVIGTLGPNTLCCVCPSVLHVTSRGSNPLELGIWRWGVER
jgi:hypothetical protein